MIARPDDVKRYSFMEPVYDQDAGWITERLIAVVPAEAYDALKAENDQLRADIVKKATPITYTGMILKDGVLHLYERPADLRAAMVEWGRDWSQVAWLHGVETHFRRTDG